MDFKKILTTMSALETAPTQLNEAFENKDQIKEAIDIHADGDDAMDLLLKLAGIQSPNTDNMQSAADNMQPVPTIAAQPNMADHMNAVSFGMSDDYDDMETDLPSIAGPGPQIDADETEIMDDFANTPDERIASFDAAIPSGTDLHREKKAFRAAAGGDNPMAVESLEEKLMNQFRAFMQEGSDRK